MFRSSADHHQGAYFILVKVTSCMVNLVMRQHTFICFTCCLVWRGMSTSLKTSRFRTYWADVGQGLLIIGASRSHSGAPHSVGFLWTSDQTDVEASLPDSTQHTKEKDIHAASGIRNRNPNKRAAADPRLRQRGHWDRHMRLYNAVTPGWPTVSKTTRKIKEKHLTIILTSEDSISSTLHLSQFRKICPHTSKSSVHQMYHFASL
jgi:hypothetical protein